MSTHEAARLRTAVLAARTVGALVVVAWGWYIITAFRSQQIGFSPGVLGVAALLVLPLAVLPFVGLRMRAVALGALLTVLAALAAAEGAAIVEETRFRAAHDALPPEAGLVVRGRRWPFTHHYLSYDPRTRTWGAGD